jgi:hypothetical protein
MQAYDYEVNFTDIADIKDEATDIEDELDVTAVREILENLAASFNTLNAVRPTCNNVMRLLDISGHNSWSDFQKEHKQLLMEYFAPQVEKTQTEVDQSVLIRAEMRRDQVKKKIQEMEASTQSWKTQLLKVQTMLSNQEMEVLATEGMEWDPETAKRHKTASDLVLKCKHQLKIMESKDPSKELKNLYLQLRYREGGVKHAQELVQGNYRVYVNSGDPKEDARLYQKLAESITWEINRLLEKEQTIEQRMSEERYSSATNGVTRFTDAPFENTTGGIYRSPVEELHEVRDDLEHQFATYHACQNGYEIAAQAFVPRYDNEWFPVWKELSQALVQTRQRARQAQINRAKSQLESFKELAKR